MTNDQYSTIGDRETTILELVDNGYSDFQRLREQVALTWRQVDYSLKKLEDAGLVTTEQQDGYITREVDGQRRKFKAPRTISLTDDGTNYLEHHTSKQAYRDMEREELIEKLYSLEQRVETLETGLESFRKQVMDKL